MHLSTYTMDGSSEMPLILAIFLTMCRFGLSHSTIWYQRICLCVYACVNNKSSVTITLILILFTQHPLLSLLPLLPQVSLSRPLTCLKYSIMHICYGYTLGPCAIKSFFLINKLFYLPLHLGGISYKF